MASSIGIVAALAFAFSWACADHVCASSSESELSAVESHEDDVAYDVQLLQVQMTMETAKQGKRKSTSSTMSLVLLPELPVHRASEGGKCMDGSPAGYYYRGPIAGDSDLWVIFLKGGGHCTNLTDCWEWGSKSGSSKKWADTISAGSFLSTSPTTNPDFYNAHHVYIDYCTGDGHAGQISEPDPQVHGGGYFDGHLNFKRIMQHITETIPAARSLKRILLYGSSAGGKGVFVNCDFLQSLVTQAGGPEDAVMCLAQSGMFFPAFWQGASDVIYPENYRTWSSGAASPAEWRGPRFGDFFNYYLPEGCKSAHVGEEVKCLSAGAIYPHIQAPIYIRQDEFDTSPLLKMGFNLADANTEHGQEYLRLFGQAMRLTLKQTISHPLGKTSDGVYLTSCFQNGQHKARVNGVHYSDSVADWFWGRGEVSHHLLDACTEEAPFLPCNPKCHGVGIGICEVTFMTRCADSVEAGSAECETCASDHLSEFSDVGCTEAEIDAMCAPVDMD